MLFLSFSLSLSFLTFIQCDTVFIPERMMVFVCKLKLNYKNSVNIFAACSTLHSNNAESYFRRPLNILIWYLLVFGNFNNEYSYLIMCACTYIHSLAQTIHAYIYIQTSNLNDNAGGRFANGIIYRWIFFHFGYYVFSIHSNLSMLAKKRKLFTNIVKCRLLIHHLNHSAMCR